MGAITRTAIRQIPLEAFANTNLAKPIGLFEDIGKVVLPQSVYDSSKSHKVTIKNGSKNSTRRSKKRKR